MGTFDCIILLKYVQKYNFNNLGLFGVIILLNVFKKLFLIRLFKTLSSFTSKIQFVISIKKQRYLTFDGEISILENLRDLLEESSNFELE